jgi:hypothetical protein
VSTLQAYRRQGKITIVAGVAAVVLGFVLQAITARSFVTQAPPQFGSNVGSTALLGEIAGLVSLGGVIITIVGIVRYAQSGSDGSTVPARALDQGTGATTSRSQASPAFCSSCGNRIVGEGRYCASCGTPTAG